jgi:hypothetical protein
MISDMRRRKGAAILAWTILGVLVSVVWVRSYWVGLELPFEHAGERRRIWLAAGQVGVDNHPQVESDQAVRGQAARNLLQEVWRHDLDPDFQTISHFGPMPPTPASPSVLARRRENDARLAAAQRTFEGAAVAKPWTESFPVAIPTLAGLLWLPPLLAASRMFRSRRHARRGRCRACGYDLRHSPLRCPACGTVATTGTSCGINNPALP